MLAAEILVAFVFCLFMGWAGRMDGGAPPKTPEWVERFIVMSPVVALGFVVSIFGGFISFAGVIGIITGHGQYFLSRAVKAIEPEKIDRLVRLAFGEDPRTAARFKHLRGIPEHSLTIEDKTEIEESMRAYSLDRLYRRNVAGMAALGIIVTLPLAIVLAASGFALSAGLALVAGAQKPIAYIVGYHASRAGLSAHLPEFLKKDTEIAEFLTRSLMAFFLYISFKAMTF